MVTDTPRIGVDISEVLDDETVESDRRGHRVCAHVREDEPLANFVEGELHVLVQRVDGVARGAKDGRGVDLALGNLVLPGLVVSPILGDDDVRRDVVVVGHAVERLVRAVVDVVEDVVAAGSVGFRKPSRDDAREEDVGVLDKVASRLGDELDALVGEELGNGGADAGGELLEGRLPALLPREAAADVDEGRLEALGGGDVEELLHLTEGGRVHLVVARARTDVEREADEVELLRLDLLDEVEPVGSLRAELAGEFAEGVLIVGRDAQHQLGVGVDLGDLGDLVEVVEGHRVDAELHGSLDVLRDLAGVRVDDPVRSEAEREHGLDLGEGSTVEIRAELAEQPDELVVRVALDRKVRLNAGKLCNPLAVLLADGADIDHVEAGLLVIDVLQLAPDNFIESRVLHNFDVALLVREQYVLGHFFALLYSLDKGKGGMARIAKKKIVPKGKLFFLKNVKKSTYFKTLAYRTQEKFTEYPISKKKSKKKTEE